MKLSGLGLKVSSAWNIGKYKDSEMYELPEKYLYWVIFDSNMDSYYINKAKRELENRGVNLDDLVCDSEVTIEDI